MLIKLNKKKFFLFKSLLKQKQWLPLPPAMSGNLGLAD
jgi:hypothetical protein